MIAMKLSRPLYMLVSPHISRTRFPRFLGLLALVAWVSFSFHASAPPSTMRWLPLPAPWADPCFQSLLHCLLAAYLITVHRPWLFQRFAAQFACLYFLWCVLLLLTLLFIPLCPARHNAIAPSPPFGKTCPQLGRSCIGCSSFCRSSRALQAWYLIRH